MRTEGLVRASLSEDPFSEDPFSEDPFSEGPFSEGPFFFRSVFWGPSLTRFLSSAFKPSRFRVDSGLI